jgi:hypothetical protein
MRKSIFRKSAWDIAYSAIMPLLFTAAVIVMIVFGLRQTAESSRAEPLRILEDSIRRAVVVAYAVDGRYPESIQYIEENFGIHIDWTRFVVHYQIFASNVFPDIAVIEL